MLALPGRGTLTGRERGAMSLPFHVEFCTTYNKEVRYNRAREEGMMRLEIYVAHECSNCEEALLIAERARGIAGLEVAVIDLDEPGRNVPLGVVAVPTYLLNGRVVSLGNPAREEFLARLRSEVRRQIEEKAS